MNAVAMKSERVIVRDEKKNLLDRFIKLFEAPEAYAAGVMAMYGSYSRPESK